MAPDVVYYAMAAYPDTPPVIRGREACVEAMSQFMEMFEAFKAEIEELIDAGDWVITVTHWQGSGAGTGASVDVREVIAWRIEAGVAIEGRVFADTKEALEAVELRE